MATASQDSPVRPPETFVTARLFARPPRVDDAPALFAAYASDPVATRYLAWTPYTSLPPLEDFLRGRAATWASAPQGDDHYAWLLCLRDSDTPFGSIGLFLDGAKVMFGYVLGQAYWGRGYASEALGFLVGWAMAEPRLRRAWAYCAVENVASARVMARAGLECEGVLRRWQSFPNLGPEPRDCVFYARVK